MAEPKLAQAENVRATLAFVARGETPLGIVYETDATIEPKVKIIGAFPDDSYPAVTYPVAATAESSNPSVESYLRFLRSSAAKTIFEHYGFSYRSNRPRRGECPLLALSGHAARCDRCPLLGVKRT